MGGLGSLDDIDGRIATRQFPATIGEDDCAGGAYIGSKQIYE